MEGSSDSPVVGTLGFHCRQGAWVRCLVRELHLLCSAPKKKVVGLEVECMRVAQGLWTEVPINVSQEPGTPGKSRGQNLQDSKAASSLRRRPTQGGFMITEAATE